MHSSRQPVVCRALYSAIAPEASLYPQGASTTVWVIGTGDTCNIRQQVEKYPQNVGEIHTWTAEWSGMEQNG